MTTFKVTLEATFSYDSEKFDNLDSIQAEAMALDAVAANPEQLTSRISKFNDNR